MQFFCVQWLHQEGLDQCIEEWNGGYRKIYGFLLLIFQFCIPICASILAYNKVTMYQKSRTRSIINTTKDDNKKKAFKLQNRKRRLVLLLMLLAFIVSWLPINTLNLMEDMGMPLTCWPYYFFSFFCSHLFAMVSTCCNPLLYGWTVG